MNKHLYEDKDVIINTFEVISDKKHKYASTHISGGNHTPISSEVEHHEHHEIWMKDLDNGVERKIEFHGDSLDVREGHKIVLLYDKLHEDFSIQTNLNTTQVTEPYYYEELTKNQKILISIAQTWYAAIGFFGWIYAFILFFGHFGSGTDLRGFPHIPNTGIRKFFMFAFNVAGVPLIYATLMGFDESNMSGFTLFLGYAISLAIHAGLAYEMNNHTNQFNTNRVNMLKNKLSDYKKERNL